MTGAGGSIGSEITKQVSSFNPEKVILFDIDETALHDIGLKLNRLYPEWEDKFYYVVGDIKDRERVYEIFEKYKPDIVFHAAAYKHVPMMEYNPREAVKVNILGSYNLAKASIKNGVGEFIVISTDKAVNPTSVMGATKRVVEYICRAFNEHNITAFVSVRFGNVLGSRGSLLPILSEQLKQGGPLTVTYPEMKRYFMTIPEAVSLVLQAATIGKPGEVLVLDMGEPVKIIELVEEFIRLHGLEPYKDIKIDIIGLRPGEKLFEELLTAEEGTISTRHERIFIAKISEKHSIGEIENLVKEFAAAKTDEEAIALLKKHVRSFIR
ncbi:MAG: polysaccharide biosynthesis protein [Geminocystis sp.]|nr:polysaccharide biosynthesis protein [Geminocystis sp.]MCS7147150.1 polysaccharide biosynthesis protein [Geminocystis sp.]